MKSWIDPSPENGRLSSRQLTGDIPAASGIMSGRRSDPQRRRRGAAETGEAAVDPIVGRFGHRLERYMLSDDPDFEQKAADVIGLYLNPPQHAVVFAVDEKTAIQALDRLDPVLPLSPGRAERHGFESYRHGTLSLYAALNTKTGEIIGQTVPRHTSEAFVDFLRDVLATQPRRREIHVIVDNLSAHKTKRVQAFLDAASPRPFAFHADLRVVAQSSGALVWQNRTRLARARHLYVAA